jgi:hypothetical protein
MGLFFGSGLAKSGTLRLDNARVAASKPLLSEAIGSVFVKESSVSALIDYISRQPSNLSAMRCC